MEKPTTRNLVTIPLIDRPPLEALSSTRLPTNDEVFRLFWHLRKVCRKSIPEAQRETAKLVSQAWERVGLVPKTVINIAKDLKGLMSSFRVKHRI